MTTKIPSTLIMLAMSAAAMSACGGTNTNTQRVEGKRELAQPTGSISDEEGLVAALGEAEQLPQVNAIIESSMRQETGCSVELHRYLSEADRAGSAGAKWSKPFNKTVDLASCGGGFSGKLAIHVEIDLLGEPNEAVTGMVGVTLSGVCDGSGACFDAEARGEVTLGRDPQRQRMIVDASLDSASELLFARVKGGGSDVTYQLRHIDAGTDAASAIIRGADGEASCSIDAARSLHCVQSGVPQ